MKRESSKDGYGSWCKECFSEYMKKRSFTKRGLITKIYTDQRKSCIARNHEMPKYSLDELYSWVISRDNFEELYNALVKSGHIKKLVPSIDRLNDYEGYNFNNIQLITWEENNKKRHSDVKNGINNKQNKTVLQYDINGNFINEYHSTEDARRKTGINNISTVCRGKFVLAGGFMWFYKECFSYEHVLLKMSKITKIPKKLRNNT